MRLRVVDDPVSIFSVSDSNSILRDLHCPHFGETAFASASEIRIVDILDLDLIRVAWVTGSVGPVLAGDASALVIDGVFVSIPKRDLKLVH